MDIKEILAKTVELGGSDTYILAESPVTCKVNGGVVTQNSITLDAETCHDLVRQLYIAAQRGGFAEFEKRGDDDFSLALLGVGRFRVNVYKQKASLAAAIRTVPFGLPDHNKLGVPEVIMNFSKLKKGLVLVTGPTGSGKSTTLACVVDMVNQTRDGHILTLEDPIEFEHKHGKSIVSQREMALDSDGYAHALRAALRQAPDVILVGEMRDNETIETALTAAETGHLVLSTLHTIGAANTIDRIVDVFPAEKQQQVRTQLAMVLKGVVSQQLIPAVGGGRVAAFEIMLTTPAICNLIRENKMHLLESNIMSGGTTGMVTMDTSILKLYRAGKITKENAETFASSPENIARETKGDTGNWK